MPASVQFLSQERQDIDTLSRDSKIAAHCPLDTHHQLLWLLFSFNKPPHSLGVRKKKEEQQQHKRGWQLKLMLRADRNIWANMNGICTRWSPRDFSPELAKVFASHQKKKKCQNAKKEHDKNVHIWENLNAKMWLKSEGYY